jgi:Carboxypeptidase regulatory-like domain
MKKNWFYFANCILLAYASFSLWTLNSMAQINEANLNGTVTDTSGARVLNAKVRLFKIDTGLTRETITGPSGVYSISSLPVGKYNLTISHEGFRTYDAIGIELFVGQTRTVDAQLQVGTTAATVNVEEQVQAVDSSNAEIAGVVQSKQVEDIPLNGRNWSTLALLAPGAVNLGGGGQRDIRFVGRGTDDNNYTFDGLDATGVQEQNQKAAVRLPISLDSIAEFRVASSQYTADKGGSAGAQVSVVTKAGTNAYHGAAFEFLRNNVFDARGPFDIDPLTNLGFIPPLRLNQFGASIGGPIQKDRTFFYANYEGLRQIQNRTVIGFVPSAAYRASVTNPALTPFLSAWPIGQTHTADPNVDQWTSPGANDQREDNGMFRLDHRFNDKTSIFGHVIIDDANINSPLDTVGGHDNPLIRTSNYVVQLTHLFSPTVINELRAGVNRSAMHHYFFGTSPLMDTLNGPAYVGASVSGFDSPSQNSLDEEIGTTIDAYDDLSIVKGRHTIKIGMGVERHRLNNSSEAKFADTTLSYASPQDFVNNSLDDYFFVGALDLAGHRRTYFMPYAQDTFKVRPNLTLYYGLRYEYYTVLKEVHGEQAVVTIACGGVCPKGTPLYGPTYRDFAPRLGLAWMPGRLGGQTVLRAGFGMYYEPNQMDDFSDGHESTGQRVDVSSADVPGLTWPLTPAQLTAPFTSPKAWDPHRHDGYFEDWSLSLERIFPHSFLGKIAYQGSQGHHLFSAVRFNRCEDDSGLTGNCIRPIPTFGEFNQKGNNGNSNFNSLQASLERHLSSGWLWGTQYMWSHDLSDVGFGAGEYPHIQNYNCIRCSYSSTDIDIRQSLSVNTVYELPFGPGKRFLTSGVAGKLLGGWELSGIGSATTGRPIDILVDVSSTDRPDGVTRNQRPDLVPGQSIYGNPKTINNWFNLNAFAVPAVGTWGTLGRNAGRGPGYYEIDTALEKSTVLTERLNLKFRAEAFNLFNHPIYGDPDSDISDGAAFGHITSELNTGPTGIGSSRKLQFMLRLEF